MYFNEDYISGLKAVETAIASVLHITVGWLEGCDWKRPLEQRQGENCSPHVRSLYTSVSIKEHSCTRHWDIHIHFAQLPSTKYDFPCLTSAIRAGNKDGDLVWKIHLASQFSGFPMKCIYAHFSVGPHSTAYFIFFVFFVMGRAESITRHSFPNECSSCFCLHQGKAEEEKGDTDNVNCVMMVSRNILCTSSCLTLQR